MKLGSSLMLNGYTHNFIEKFQGIDMLVHCNGWNISEIKLVDEKEDENIDFLDILSKTKEADLLGQRMACDRDFYASLAPFLCTLVGPGIKDNYYELEDYRLMVYDPRIVFMKNIFIKPNELCDGLTNRMPSKLNKGKVVRSIYSLQYPWRCIRSGDMYSEFGGGPKGLPCFGPIYKIDLIEGFELN